VPTFTIKEGGYFYASGKTGEMKMESKHESRTARIWIIAVLIAFAILAICVAAYYYTFHGYKKQRPAVAPTAMIVLLEANKTGPPVGSPIVSMRTIAVV
jgi:flagellar basal body-associated protein FliL